MNTTQQAEALPALIERFRGLHFDHAPDGWPAVRTREITALLDRITELESQLAQRFDAADLPEALRRSTAADGKTELFNLPGYPLMVRAVDFNRVHTESEMRRAALLDEMQKAALAAGQATAAQPGVVYAELPVPNYPKSGGFPGTFAEAQMRAFADATHTLRASHGQAPAQPDPAYSEARNLATALFKKHFAHLPDFASGQAVWSLCDSTAGVISQIDNMVAGLVQPPTSPQADSVQEDAARYRWLRRWKGQEHEPPFTVQHEIDGTLWGGDLDAAIDAAMNKGATQ